MNETQRLRHLASAIDGSGAKVNDPYGIDAHGSQLADDHVVALAGWADLEFLIANLTRITDVSLPLLCEFNRLTDLAIGGTRITDSAICAAKFPNSLTHVSLFGIPLTDSSVENLRRCTNLTDLVVRGCGLSRDSLFTLSGLRSLRSMSARGSNVDEGDSADLSHSFPNIQFVLNDGVWMSGIRQRKFDENDG